MPTEEENFKTLIKSLENCEFKLPNIDLIPGKHWNTPDSDFDPIQLGTGIKVELEHTNNNCIAKQIAKDHLSEIKDYYDRLYKMETDAIPK